MCKKSEERKFNHYDIKIVNNLNRTTEDISLLNEEKVDKSNYKQMLEVYREIKEQYKDQDVTIDFCGVANDSSIKVMWKKEYKLYNDTKTIFELCDELNNLVNEIDEQIGDRFNQMSVYDKQQDLFLHKLENLDQKNIYEMTNSEKNNILKIAINIQDIRHQRRWNKYNIRFSQSIKDRNLHKQLLNINNEIQNISSVILNKVDKIDEKVKLGVKSSEYVEKHYKNFKDRIRIMKELQEEFETVKYDESRKMCMGYNKCRH